MSCLPDLNPSMATHTVLLWTHTHPRCAHRAQEPVFAAWNPAQEYKPVHSQAEDIGRYCSLAPGQGSWGWRSIPFLLVPLEET
jgi:hypothetical protein